jgi:hypothetical protein
MSKRVIIVLLLIVLSIGLISASCVRHRPERKAGEIHNRSIEQVFDSHREALLATPGVVGVGIARLEAKPCIVVMVMESTPDLENHVPKQLEGYTVIIELIGDMKIQERD